MKECVGAYITDPQVSVREAAVELLSRLVRQDATMIEHYLPTIFERTRVRLEQFCRLIFIHRSKDASVLVRRKTVRLLREIVEHGSVANRDGEVLGVLLARMTYQDLTNV